MANLRHNQLKFWSSNVPSAFQVGPHYLMRSHAGVCISPSHPSASSLFFFPSDDFFTDASQSCQPSMPPRSSGAKQDSTKTRPRWPLLQVWCQILRRQTIALRFTASFARSSCSSCISFSAFACTPKFISSVVRASTIVRPQSLSS